MQALRINGWTIRFAEPFKGEHEILIDRVKSLKSKLPDKEFSKHRDVKMLAALRRAYEELIPEDPFDSRFSLTGPLKRFQRHKGMGLDNRYRLFFKAFDKEKVIVILWLGFPRKDGDKSDCYRVFKKWVDSGKVPCDMKTLLTMCREG